MVLVMSGGANTIRKVWRIGKWDDLFHEASPLEALGLQTVTYQNIENAHLTY